MNINANKSISRNLVEIPLIMHLDASGKETFLMEWLKSPQEQRRLFGNMGVSVPQILDGYCGFESQFTNYCQDTLVTIADLPTTHYKLQNYPNNRFEVRLSKFTADRHAEGAPMGWMVGNCHYPSGVTTEHRSTWTQDLIPQTEGFFPTIGCNYARHHLTEEIIQDKTVARKIDDRRKIAWSKYGKMAGEPGLAFLIRRYPYIARVSAALPIFHGRGHVASFYDYLSLRYLDKFGSENFDRLKKEWDQQQSNIAIGRLATSGSRLFKITHQVAHEFGQRAMENDENLIYRANSILIRRLLEITLDTDMPTNRQLAEHRVVGGLYWSSLVYVAKEFVRRKVLNAKDIRGGLK